MCTYQQAILTVITRYSFLDPTLCVCFPGTQVLKVLVERRASMN